VRSSEWLVAGYFAYVTILAAVFFGASPATWKSLATAAVVVSLIALLARFPKHGRSFTRDFAPIFYTLAAYREMDWFTPATHAHRLERIWIVWDRRLLDHGLRGAIESAGIWLPGFLELCYALVYAVALVSIIAILANERRAQIDTFWLAYLVGTLGAYALFPFFPSEPPRTVFPGADLPHITTWLRDFNLSIVGAYGIHSSVFPSAHVSSAFSAAWGLLAAIPRRKWIGWSMFAYGVAVAIATVYGRYHYAVDAVAGMAMSLFAPAALALEKRYSN